MLTTSLLVTLIVQGVIPGPDIGGLLLELNTPRVSTGLIIIGIAFLIFGVLVRSGRRKRWYLSKGDPVYSPKELALVCIPAGLMFVFTGIAALLPTPEARQAIFWGVAFPLCIAAIILLLWLPDWIKPAWVRWLEKNHENILLLLVEDARQTPDWEQRVATQAGLEAWVAEVRRKHWLESTESTEAQSVPSVFSAHQCFAIVPCPGHSAPPGKSMMPSRRREKATGAPTSSPSAR